MKFLIPLLLLSGCSKPYVSEFIYGDKVRVLGFYYFCAPSRIVEFDSYNGTYLVKLDCKGESDYIEKWFKSNELVLVK